MKPSEQPRQSARRARETRRELASVILAATFPAATADQVARAAGDLCRVGQAFRRQRTGADARAEDRLAELHAKAERGALACAGQGGSIDGEGVVIAPGGRFFRAELRDGHAGRAAYLLSSALPGADRARGVAIY